MSALLEQFLTPSGIATAIGVLLTGIGLVMGGKEVRRRRVALAVYHGYQIVNDIDAERGDTTLDKVVEGLKAADNWMKSNGWRQLRTGEQDIAIATFKSIHGQEKQAVKMQAEAQALAAQLAAAADVPVPTAPGPAPSPP